MRSSISPSAGSLIPSRARGSGSVCRAARHAQGPRRSASAKRSGARSAVRVRHRLPALLRAASRLCLCARVCWGGGRPRRVRVCALAAAIAAGARAGRPHCLGGLGACDDVWYMVCMCAPRRWRLTRAVWRTGTGDPAGRGPCRPRLRARVAAWSVPMSGARVWPVHGAAAGRRVEGRGVRAMVDGTCCPCSSVPERSQSRVAAQMRPDWPSQCGLRVADCGLRIADCGHDGCGRVHLVVLDAGHDVCAGVPRSLRVCANDARAYVGLPDSNPRRGLPSPCARPAPRRAHHVLAPPPRPGGTCRSLGTAIGRARVRRVRVLPPGDR